MAVKLVYMVTLNGILAVQMYLNNKVTEGCYMYQNRTSVYAIFQKVFHQWLSNVDIW